MARDILFSTSILSIILFGVISCAATDGTRVESNQGTVTVSNLIVEQGGVMAGTFSDGVNSLFVEYPDPCYEAGIEGMVEISLNIRDTGELIDARVERGIGEECDESALATIRNSEFEPAMDMDGMPVVARHIVLISFSR